MAGIMYTKSAYFNWGMWSVHITVNPSCARSGVIRMRKLGLFAAAFALAAGAFWTVVLTRPPQSEAATARAAQPSKIEAVDHCVAYGVCP